MGYGGYNNGGGGWGGGYRGPSGQRQQYGGNRGGGQQRNGDGPATPNQRAFLERHGRNPNVSFSVASRQIDEIKGGSGGGDRPCRGQSGGYPRQPRNQGGYGGGGNSNQCTAKQAAVLEKNGYDPNVSFDEASAIIDELKANGWQRPDGGGDQSYGGDQYGGNYETTGDGYDDHGAGGYGSSY